MLNKLYIVSKGASSCEFRSFFFLAFVHDLYITIQNAPLLNRLHKPTIDLLTSFASNLKRSVINVTSQHFICSIF